MALCRALLMILNDCGQKINLHFFAFWKALWGTSQPGAAQRLGARLLHWVEGMQWCGDSARNAVCCVLSDGVHLCPVVWGDILYAGTVQRALTRGKVMAELNDSEMFSCCTHGFDLWLPTSSGHDSFLAVLVQKQILTCHASFNLGCHQLSCY